MQFEQSKPLYFCAIGFAGFATIGFAIRQCKHDQLTDSDFKSDVDQLSFLKE